MSEFITPDDLAAVGDSIFDAIAPGARRDWSAISAYSLEWTVQETVVHMVSTCGFMPLT